MKRKGFTLVELLIVIVVIGILSAMMMLSSTEATSSAKATAIVGNLRNLKTAALAYYADNMATWDGTNSLTADDIRKEVIKYLTGSSGGDSATQDIDSNYTFVVNNGDWYVNYAIQGSATEKARIQDKLEKRAKDAGLCKGSTTAPEKDTAYTKTGDTTGDVAMFIR